MGQTRAIAEQLSMQAKAYLYSVDWKKARTSGDDSLAAENLRGLESLKIELQKLGSRVWCDSEDATPFYEAVIRVKALSGKLRRSEAKFAEFQQFERACVCQIIWKELECCMQQVLYTIRWQ